jgi:hypothetical protein
MSETPDPPEFSTASHAYEHAEHVGDRPTHRLDVTDSPRWPKPPAPPRPAPPVAAPGRPDEHVVTHRVETPARTAFKFGFGFAAGVWTFRALVLLVVWAVLAIAISALLMRAFPS